MLWAAKRAAAIGDRQIFAVQTKRNWTCGLYPQDQTHRGRGPVRGRRAGTECRRLPLPTRHCAGTDRDAYAQGRSEHGRGSPGRSTTGETCAVRAGQRRDRHPSRYERTGRVALVHDYLTQRGGAERVVLALAAAFPGAPVHTSLYDPDGTFPEFSNLDVRTLPLDRSCRPAGPSPPGPSVARPGLLEAQRRRRGGRVLVQRLGPRCLRPPVAKSSTATRRPGGSTKPTAIWPVSPRPRPPCCRCIAPSLRRWDRRAAASAHRYLVNSTRRPPAGVRPLRHRCRGGAPARGRRPARAIRRPSPASSPGSCSASRGCSPTRTSKRSPPPSGCSRASAWWSWGAGHWPTRSPPPPHRM